MKNVTIIIILIVLINYCGKLFMADNVIIILINFCGKLSMAKNVI